MKKAIIYSYVTEDSRNSGWYKVGLTTTDADKRIAQQDKTSNYQKPVKLVDFDFTDLVNKRGVSVEDIEKEFHNYLRYKLRLNTRKDKQREWFQTFGLGPIYEAKAHVLRKFDVEEKKPFIMSPSGKYQWQWDDVLKPTINYFKKADKGNSIIFCGGGKTLLTYWMTRLIRPLLQDRMNIAVVCVPSIYLVQQTLNTYIEQSKARNENFEFLCVCTDNKLKNSVDADMRSEDLPLNTTNPAEIRRFIESTNDRKGLRVIFTTYQSGKKLAQALKGITVDFAVYDEVHKALGDDKKLFSHLLLDKNFKAQKKWFITATPKESQE